MWTYSFGSAVSWSDTRRKRSRDKLLPGAGRKDQAGLGYDYSQLILGRKSANLSQRCSSFSKCCPKRHKYLLLVDILLTLNKLPFLKKISNYISSCLDPYILRLGCQSTQTYLGTPWVGAYYLNCRFFFFFKIRIRPRLPGFKSSCATN